MDGFDLDGYLKELEYLVSIDSKTNDPAGVDLIGDYFFEKYAALGLRVKRIYFGNSVGRCLEISNTDSPHVDCLMLGHLDTVFPKGTASIRPFSCRDGVAYGPGVIDMKSGLLSIYHIARRLLACENPPAFRIILNSHEEITSGLSKDWISQCGSKSKFCLVFESARADGALVHKRSGIARICVELTGRFAHAGNSPLQGRSAIHEMGRFIVDVVPLSDYDKGTFINVGLVEGGIGANIIAKTASCEIDIRFKSLEEYMRIKKRIEECAQQSARRGVQAVVEERAFCPPFIVDRKTEALMGVFESVAEQLNVAIGWRETAGASDGNFVSAGGIPVIDGCGPIGNCGHSEEEYLMVDSVEPRIEYITQSILAACKSLGESPRTA